MLEPEKKMIALLLRQPEAITQLPAKYLEHNDIVRDALALMNDTYSRYRTLSHSLCEAEAKGSRTMPLKLIKAMEANPDIKSLSDDDFRRELQDTRNILHNAYAQRTFSGRLEEAIRKAEAGEVPHTIITELSREIINPTVKPMNFFDHLRELALKPELPVFPTGIARMDAMSVLRKRNGMLLAGDTGAMKTMWGMYLVRKILEANPTFKAVIFQKEMDVEDMVMREMQNIYAKDEAHVISNYRDLIDAIDLASDDTAMKKLYGRIFYVRFSDFNTVEDMWAYINEIKPDIWMLDYVQLMGSDDDQNPTIAAQNMALGLKNLILASNTFGIILSQLKADWRKGKGKLVPHLDDVVWGTYLKHLSTWAFMSFYPAKYYPAEFVDRRYYYAVCVKNRFNAQYVLPFRARPEYADFGEEALAEVDEWYHGYISGGKG